VVSSRVYVYYTGGTIGMSPEASPRAGGASFGALQPAALEGLLAHLPSALPDTRPGVAFPRDDGCVVEFARGHRVELCFGSVEQPFDSANLCPEDWVNMARAIEQVYDDYDGFVILHGTDTMAYSASALSFMLDNLAKPVVLTGAQTPIGQAGSDAPYNLMDAVLAASGALAGASPVPEVLVVFAGRVLRGNRTRKLHAQARAAFESPNYPALGTINAWDGLVDIQTDIALHTPKTDRKLCVANCLATEVYELNVFPGVTVFGAHLEKWLHGESRPRALVLLSYGVGNVPEALLGTLRRYIQTGGLVLNITRCQSGAVDMARYRSAAGLREIGVLSGADMTPEAGLTKLMWALGSGSPSEHLERIQQNQRGELSNAV